jgi:hypothetical protein
MPHKVSVVTDVSTDLPLIRDRVQQALINLIQKPMPCRELRIALQHSHSGEEETSSRFPWRTPAVSRIRSAPGSTIAHIAEMSTLAREALGAKSLTALADPFPSTETAPPVHRPWTELSSRELSCCCSHRWTWRFIACSEVCRYSRQFRVSPANPGGWIWGVGSLQRHGHALRPGTGAAGLANGNCNRTHVACPRALGGRGPNVQ